MQLSPWLWENSRKRGRTFCGCTVCLAARWENNCLPDKSSDCSELGLGMGVSDITGQRKGDESERQQQSSRLQSPLEWTRCLQRTFLETFCLSNMPITSHPQYGLWKTNVGSKHWERGRVYDVSLLFSPLIHVHLLCVCWKNEVTNKSAMKSLHRGLTLVCFTLCQESQGADMTHHSLWWLWGALWLVMFCDEGVGNG